eukprot:scaffold1182_cov396-Prasinococcus_capsulatus_cf.AAC.7
MGGRDYHPPGLPQAGGTTPQARALAANVRRHGVGHPRDSAQDRSMLPPNATKAGMTLSSGPSCPGDGHGLCGFDEGRARSRFCRWRTDSLGAVENPWSSGCPYVAQVAECGCEPIEY